MTFLAERPRDPEIQRPRDPETQRPRDPETQRPRDPRRLRDPGDPRRLGDPETQRPRDPETQRPRDPETQRPRDPEAQRPRGPEARRPRDLETQRPRDPRDPETGKPTLSFQSISEVMVSDVTGAFYTFHVLFFRKYVVFFLFTAFAHTYKKAGKDIYDCGDVSVTTARSARLNNCYKKARYAC